MRKPLAQPKPLKARKGSFRVRGDGGFTTNPGGGVSSGGGGAGTGGGGESLAKNTSNFAKRLMGEAMGDMGRVYKSSMSEASPLSRPLPGGMDGRYKSSYVPPNDDSEEDSEYDTSFDVMMMLSAILSESTTKIKELLVSGKFGDKGVKMNYNEAKNLVNKAVDKLNKDLSKQETSFFTVNSDVFVSTEAIITHSHGLSYKEL